jgi:hypothetical protein
MTTTNNVTKTPAAAKVLTPNELAERLIIMSDGVSTSWQDEDAVKEAEAALAAAKAKVDRAGEKRLRVLRAASVEEAEAILKESDADANLKTLCHRVSGWKPLQEGGGTDEQIKAVLSKWPKERRLPHVVPSCESGYGVNQLYAWVDPDKSPKNPSHLSGQKLVDAVRRVMNIPKPAAKPPATPSPAKKKTTPKGKSKPTAAAAAPKAQPAGGDDDDDAGGAIDQVDESGGDPNVNEHGVFVRGVKSYSVPGVPKPAKVTIKTALSAGGAWRSAYDVLWGAHQHGSGSGVSLRGTPYATEADAIAAKAEWIVENYRRMIESERAEKAKSIYRRAMAAVEKFLANKKPPPKTQTIPRAELCDVLHGGAKPAKAKPEVKRVSGGARAEMDRVARHSSDEMLKEHLLTLAHREVPNADGLDEMRRDVMREELARRSREKLKTTPAEPKPAGGVAHRPQTFGQWAATLRGIKNGHDFDPNLPTLANPDEREQFFLGHFRRGTRPADARDAWEKRADAAVADSPHHPITPSAPPAPLPSVAALAKPRTPMPTPADEDQPVPRQPHGQSLTWYQWRNLFEQVYHKVMEKAGRPHEGVGVEDFEPKGELLEMYNRGLKPSAAAKSYVDLLVARDAKPAPAKVEKPKEVVAARDAHDAVIAAGGTFEQALAAGTKEITDEARRVEAGEKLLSQGVEIVEDDASQDAKYELPGARIGGLAWHRDGKEWWAPNTAGVEGDPDVMLDFVVNPDAGGGWDVNHSDRGLMPERMVEWPDRFATENDAKAWCERRNAELMKPAAGAPETGPANVALDDPNADGRGVYVSGVEEIVVRGEAKGDKAKIVIRVARGADGLFRTGHLLEFRGAGVWNADSDKPVHVSGQAAELRHYAIKTRAEILMHVINTAPGKDGVAGATWSAEQRATYTGAIKALELFVQYNPACKPAAPGTAGGAKAKAG